MNLFKMKRISIAPDVLAREVGGETVILDLKTERYLSLDEIGTRMWNLLLESGSVDSVYKTLSEEFDVDASRLETDLRELIDKLIQHGLVTVEGDTGAA
jgi:hypothetical protein